MQDDQTKTTLKSLVLLSQEVESELIDSGGEITERLEKMLSVIETKLPEKIDGYQLFMERMSHVAAFYEAKADQMAKMASSATKLQSKLKDNIKFAMIELGTDEILGVDHKFKLQKSPPAVIIESDEKVPESYKTVKHVVSVDKKRIKDDLALGVPVEGCRLEHGFSLRSYANKAK